MGNLSELTLERIRSKYNEESIFKFGEFPEKTSISFISTGSLLLDDALGIGGVPRDGRFTEIIGPEGSGKTTLCQHIIANAQAQDLTCAFIDIENAVDPVYAQACGVDLDNLYFSQPGIAEEALGIAEELIKSGELQLIVLDSLASLSPESEHDGKFEDKNVTGMLRAKLLNVFFRRTMRSAKKNDVGILMTNQWRDNTGSFFGGRKAVGGHGVKYYASVRISLWNDDDIEDSGKKVGQIVEATIRKSKVSEPFKVAKFPVIGGKGIDKPSDVFTVAKELGVINNRGAYYYYNSENIAQGKYNTIMQLEDNPELLQAVEEECRQLLMGG
jgi:recombination protein RecA